jgi:hypothetical protein
VEPADTDRVLERLGAARVTLRSRLRRAEGARAQRRLAVADGRAAAHGRARRAIATADRVLERPTPR